MKKISSNPNSFKIFINDYAKDNKNSFYEGKIIWNDWNGFVVLKTTAYSQNWKISMDSYDWYAKDSKNVYYLGKIIWADPKTFVPLLLHYAKDKNNAYYRWGRIIWADAKTFTIDGYTYTTSWWYWKARDKYWEYFNWTRIKK